MASPNSRQTLIDFCLRRLGEPVLEINVDVDQIEDKVDDALQRFREFHADATLRTFLKHEVTQTDIDNKYIPIPDSVIFISRVFPINTTFSYSGNMFDIRYQMYLNNMGDFTKWAGDLNYLYQMQQYLELVDQQLSGQPQVRYNRYQDRLYIDGDFNDNDLKVGDFVVVEMYQIIDEDEYSGVWNDMWLKDYTTALIKQQWGANLIKFEGMQLPGGVTMNGRQIYDDAMSDIDKLEERIRSEQELPVDFFMG